MVSYYKNNKGESLAETLIASLIIGLAMIMVLTISQITSRLSRQADDSFSDYYDKANLYEKLEITGLTSTGESASVTVYLYDDGYQLGSGDTVQVLIGSQEINGREILYSYIG